jgi:hypothetical protein
MRANIISTVYSNRSLMLSHIEVLVGRGVQFAVCPEPVTAPPGAKVKLVGGERWMLSVMEQPEAQPETVA